MRARIGIASGGLGGAGNRIVVVSGEFAVRALGCESDATGGGAFEIAEDMFGRCHVTGAGRLELGAEKLVCDPNIWTGGDVQPGESANKRLILCDEFCSRWLAVNWTAVNDEAGAIRGQRRLQSARWWRSRSSLTKPS